MALKTEKDFPVGSTQYLVGTYKVTVTGTSRNEFGMLVVQYRGLGIEAEAFADQFWNRERQPA